MCLFKKRSLVLEEFHQALKHNGELDMKLLINQVNKVTETAHFQKDLGLDSLDRVELVMAFEQEFSVEIPDEKADKLACCADVVNYIISEAKNDVGESHGS
ncbi:hypothetical protein Taro_033898 [Colocasia esculenta]|uniref:Acyl carrier protein n=1 Tax=Colocasia esculenta TaxID=4460 RepID=A0A843VV15_COLES|nr:hypothetical protein [Colocasia esculenta]